MPLRAGVALGGGHRPTRARASPCRPRPAPARRAARPCARGRRCTLLAVELGVGPGEVDELEQAQLRVDALGGNGRTDADAVGVDHDHLARLDLAHEVRADDVERRASRDASTQPPSSRPSTSGRKPCGSRTPIDVALVHQHERERALERGQHRRSSARSRSRPSAASLGVAVARAASSSAMRSLSDGDRARAACRPRRPAPRCS